MMRSHAIPTCQHKDEGKICGTQAMPNTQECARHWLLARGWDEAKGEYRDEPMPFEQGDEDTQHWTDELEATRQTV
jgi:hypothetical protein